VSKAKKTALKLMMIATRKFSFLIVHCQDRWRHSTNLNILFPCKFHENPVVFGCMNAGNGCNGIGLLEFEGSGHFP